jgi:transposase-like protein
MPFCPNCRDEFQYWVKVCPDCGSKLVDQLQQELVYKSAPERLVTVADYYYSPLAYLSQAKLESEGILSFVFDEYIINANWLYLIAVGGVKLKVGESDAAEAVRILEKVRSTIPGVAEYSEDGCPQCGSSYIHYETFHIRWTYILMLISNIIDPGAFALCFLFFKNRWKCNNCGYQWKDKKKSIQSSI